VPMRSLTISRFRCFWEPYHPHRRCDCDEAPRAGVQRVRCVLVRGRMILEQYTNVLLDPGGMDATSTLRASNHRRAAPNL
jgi:hypothetical protein